ncbi:MAG: 4-(cytidine 5'-diphospho)-2-C-methyl-D-erythritol kinase [Thermodesulfobacteriota bacterium]
MREPVILTAGCKINLALAITGLRPDGFHELDTLFLPLPEPRDTITVTAGTPGKGLVLACSDPGLSGPSNTMARAYSAFARATRLAPDLAVRLDKGIPTGAGLGGGSSDAATLLLHLNALAGERALDPAALTTLAAGVGADVPFFLLNRPARGTGIGERLIPASPGLDGLFLLLLCPPEPVNTGWAYRAWDDLPPAQKTPPRAVSEFLTWAAAGDKRSSCFFRACLWNSFENAVFPAHPGLRRIKEDLLRRGACGACLSGSGSSLLGLFRDRVQAERAAEAFSREGVTSFVHQA